MIMKGDWVDRINDFWSVLLLSICAIGSVLIRSFPSMLSKCWCPAHFTPSNEAYTEASHFLAETYYVPSFTIHIPAVYNETAQSYHLWIPIILFMQALAFKVPQSLSTLLEPFVPSCVANTDLRPSGNAVSTTEKEDGERTARLMAEFLISNNVVQTFMYFCKKVLFCINLILQIVFLQVMFKSGRHIVPESSVNGTMYPELPIGPLLHDFSIMRNTEVHRFTVQCISSGNEVYDKLFIFLWYWIIFVCILTVISTALWVVYVIIPRFSQNKLKIYLTSANHDVSGSDVDSFVKNFLGWDGVLLLQMLSVNGFELHASVLTNELWIVFQEKLRATAVAAVSLGVTEADISKGIQLDCSAESPLMPACPENTPVNAPEKPFPVDVTFAEIHSSAGITE